MSLGELVRQERFGAGPSDQKNLDSEMAGAIARDGKFEVSETSLVERNHMLTPCRMTSSIWTITRIDWRGRR